MRTLILNFKNYPEVQGDGAIRLSRAAERSNGVAEIIVCPPTPMISLVASQTKLKVFSQSVSDASGEKTTGSVVPEAVLASGGRGTILNHSENRLPMQAVGRLTKRMDSIGMEVCLCARSSSEGGRLARFETSFLAIEPPELIGTGVAVSNAKPRVVSDTVAAVRKAGYAGKILCGAGITSSADVERAVELGVDGVLVSSSVVKAGDWASKIWELASSLDTKPRNP